MGDMGEAPLAPYSSLAQARLAVSSGKLTTSQLNFAHQEILRLQKIEEDSRRNNVWVFKPERDAKLFNINGAVYKFLYDTWRKD